MRPVFVFVLICLSYSAVGQSSARFPFRIKRPYRTCGTLNGDLVGVGYDFNNNLYGLKAHNFLFSHSEMMTDLDFRLPRKGNSYFSMDAATEIGLEWLSASIGYKRISFDHQALIEQFYFGAGIYRSRVFNLSVNYARQQKQLGDGQFIFGNGIVVNVFREFFYSLNVRASFAYGFSTQYFLQLRKIFFERRFAVGIGGEKVDNWRGIDLDLMYMFR